MTPALVARAQQLADEAVGLVAHVRVRHATRRESGVVVEGKIVRCEVAGARTRARSEVVQFRVWLEGRGEPYLLESLPRP